MGVPIYPPALESDLLKPFYEGLAQGELRLTANARTGDWVWYPQAVIPGCPDDHLEWRTVSPEGSIYAFTRIERSLLPGDHRGETPFTVVLFESDDARGARIPGLFVAPAGTEPVCGMRARLHPVEAGEVCVAGFEPI
jgi:uncharacterized OB-fold protein